MLRAGMVFAGVCLSVCVGPHKISKTTEQKLMQLGKNMPHAERWKCLEVGDIWPWSLTLKAIFVFFQLRLYLSNGYT